MYNNLLEKLERLPLPTAVTSFDAKKLLLENIDDAKVVLGEGWIHLESDPYVKNLKILTLRQLHNQEQKNITVRKILLTVATGSDLDHLGIGEHVERLDGISPIAKVELSISSPNSKDITFKKGTTFTDATGSNKSFLIEDVTLEEGKTVVEATARLDSFVETSPLRCEFSNNLDVDVKQLTDFVHGATIEDDSRYRTRIIQSQVQYNTAGSNSAYKFHTFSSDNRIDDVEVGDGDGVHVPIYIYSKSGVTDELIEKVDSYLNQKHLKPVNDKPVVSAVLVKSINISLDIYVFDLFDISRIKKEIEDAFVFNFYIGKNFTKSELISKCHVAGVYEAVTSFNGLTTTANEIIEMESIKLNFKEARV